MTKMDDIEQVFRRYYEPMLVLANRLLHDEDAARDVVQDIFKSLLDKGLAGINAQYLMGAVRYACFKYVRDLSSRERLIRAYWLDADTADAAGRPDDEDYARLESYVNEHLSQKTRTILNLKFVKNLKYREIAQELSISEVAVYKHLRGAIDTLRQHFKDDER